MSDVADTSKQSYRKLDRIKEMSQCDKILEALKKSDKALTVNELNQTALADLDIPNGRVSARINKLKDQGKVVEDDKREDMFSGREAKTWTNLVSENNTKTADSVQDSNTTNDSEFVSMSEANNSESEESTDGLFIDDTQNQDKACDESEHFEPGDVIYG